MVMKLRTQAPNWFNEDHPEQQAKCVLFPGTRDNDPWFGTSIYSDADQQSEMEEAKRICHGTDDKRPCPLLSACREFAVINNEKYGVWGGTTPEERREIRRGRRGWPYRQVGETRSSQEGSQTTQEPERTLSS